MSITNHYGVWVDSDKPTTSVYNLNDCPEWFLENTEYINLDYENALEEHKAECESCQSGEECNFSEYWEDQPSDTKLVGDWVKNENGQYLPDKSGEYAAIENESTVQVVYSKYTKRYKSLCSPCFPGQVNVDSDNETDDNGFLAYVLPTE